MSNKKITDAQQICMVEFMEENYQYLSGDHPTATGNKSKGKKLKDFEKEMNDLGPSIRSWEKWKKIGFAIGYISTIIPYFPKQKLRPSFQTWADWKSHTKEKACSIVHKANVKQFKFRFESKCQIIADKRYK